MKKFCLAFIMCILPTCVFAEKITEDWHTDLSYESWFIKETTDEYRFGANYFDGVDNIGDIRIDKNGKVTSAEGVDDFIDLYDSDGNNFNKGVYVTTVNDIRYVINFQSLVIEEYEDDDPTEYEFADFTDSELKNILGDYYFIYDKFIKDNEDDYVYDIKAHDEKVLVSYIEYDEEYNVSYWINLYDKDGNLLLNKEINDNTENDVYLDFNKNYIYALNYKDKYILEKYDMKGNLVKSINYSEIGSSLDDDMYLINLHLTDNNKILIDAYSTYDGTGITDSRIIRLNVETEVTVEGEVNGAVKITKEDGTVKAEVTPDDGYVLDDIVILDSNDNKIEYTKNDNVYTFDDVDATIKVSFVKKTNKIVEVVKNPNTGSKILIISILSLIALGGIAFSKSKLSKIQRFN